MPTPESAPISSHETPDSRLNKLSSSPESQLRLEAVEQVFADLSAEHHDIAGVTVFGSTARGEAKETSDIDGYMYVDVEASDELDPDTCLELTQTKYSNEITFSGDLAGGMAAEVHVRLDEKLGEEFTPAKHEADPYKDFMVVPVSEALIDHNLDQALEGAQQIVEAQQAVAEYDDYYDNLEGLHDYEPPEIPEVPDEISRQFKGLFHPEAAGNLDSYRKQILSKLEAAGPAGDHIWQRIKDFVEMFEDRYGESGLPDSAADAAAKYGVNKMEAAA